MKMAKKIATLFLIIAILFSGCRAKRSYKTMEGKKKLKFYNSVPYE